MAKPSKTVIYTLVGAVLVATYFMTSPTGVENPTTRRRPASSDSRKKVDVQVFTEEDEKASYARITSGSKNVFEPYVKKENALANSELLSNQVPPQFVDGKLTWFFTGTADVNNVETAMLEDTSTGSWEYVKVGDTFFKATITGITRNTVEMSGPGGNRTLILIENKPIVDPKDLKGNQPLNPLSGPVNVNRRGLESSTLPDPTQPLIAADPTIPAEQPTLTETNPNE